ncbi:MAG TPA: xanthine dehydrogenase family protein molybdopterin-binding subunit [Xanthobacteraceae bacterium]|nr:xanthine dehydrogenase family protein molybdopterin-binding subunit [Xanthobacteraceae bacterium]
MAGNAKSDGGRGWVGRSIRRLEDPTLVAGRGRFAGDLPAARWVRFVRSPVAAGRIVRISAPEGALIVTAADLAAVKPIRPMLHKFNYVPISQPVLAREVVRFVGEPVAAVISPSREEAEDVADRVEVEIEASPAVVGADVALARGAELVHPEAAGNVAVEGRLKTPGFDTHVARAHERIRLDVRSHRQNALPIEPRAAHAAWDGASERITLTCATQMPHALRTIVADLIAMPESDLRVIAPDVGGGFGQKMSLAAEFVVVTWLARKLRSSVAWVEDRRENLVACFHSRDQSISLEGAFDADAKLIGLSADIVADVGAYSCYPTTCAVEPLMAMAELPGPYDVREYACVSRGVLTNTCPMAPYRGVSRPVITLAIERLMDKAAAVFGLDPIEIRRRNLVKAFPHTTVTGLVFDEASYVETMEAAVKAAGVPAFRARQTKARAEGRYLGLGVATFCERTGYGTQAFAARGMEVTPGWETVEMSMDPSGYIEARIGASPHGQGLRTTLSQIIADELGTSPERIKIVHGDTDRTPYGWGTFASRSLVIAGGASLLAARKIRAKLIKMAGIMLEASADDIVLEADAARVAGTDRSIPLVMLARAAYHQTHRFKGDVAPGIVESATYDPLGTFSNACHLAVVEVDAETGRVGIEKFLVAEDAGRLINPMIVDGQIQGGVAQGIANALFEEIIYDDTGNILTASLADYLPPTAREVPAIEIHHLATLTPASVTKAKGLGEGGTIGAPAAVLNAINDALSPFAVSIDELPATPQRIRAALRAADARSKSYGT